MASTDYDMYQDATQCIMSAVLGGDYREMPTQIEANLRALAARVEAQATPERYGHPRFHELLDHMRDLHSRKNQDYAGKADPLQNLRWSEAIGIDGATGTFVRMGDKWARLVNLMRQRVETGVTSPAVKSEQIEDTLLDLAVYSILEIVLLEEAGREHKRAASTNYTPVVPLGLTPTEASLEAENYVQQEMNFETTNETYARDRQASASDTNPNLSTPTTHTINQCPVRLAPPPSIEHEQAYTWTIPTHMRVMYAEPEPAPAPLTDDSPTFSGILDQATYDRIRKSQAQQQQDRLGNTAGLR